MKIDFRSAIRKNRTYRRFHQLKKFLSESGISLKVFILPGFLSFISAFFHGLGISLLIPMLKGILDKDFGFVKEIPVLKNIIEIIPNHLVSTNTSIFIFLIALTAAAAVIQQGTRYLGRVILAYQMRKFMSEVRKRIVGRYLSFGKLFFDRSSFGYLNNILMNFTNTISLEIGNLQNVIVAAFTLIIYLILMFSISWQMTLLVLVIFPVLYFGFKKLVQKIKKTSEEMAFSQGQLSNKVFNMLSCLPLIKMYSREKEDAKEFSRLSDTTARLQFLIDKKYFLITPIQEIFMIILMLFIMTIVAFIVVKHKAADMSGFLIYFYILKKSSTAMGIFALFRGALARIEGPMRGVMQIFDDKDKYFDVGGKKEFDGLKKEIRVNNLTFSYVKGIKVLENVSFSIPKGKMTAIVGPTGSGKTTIINLILRFYDCLPSSIFIDDVDVREFTLKSLRQSMAVVSQGTLLFNDTLRKNITYGLYDVSEKQLVDIVKKARLYDFILKLPEGFDTPIGDRGVKLSGGEKQRVSIARAMLKGSEIIILDEATSSLDTRTERLIQEAIETAAKGKTVIAIAHRLSTIKNADKIVVIEDGKLAEKGSMESLLAKKGKFYQYWNEQKFY